MIEHLQGVPSWMILPLCITPTLLARLIASPKSWVTCIIVCPLAVQAPQHPPDAVLEAGIDRCHRLIKQQYAGISDQCPCQCNTLLLSP
ncbi:MAG: hypothetical protein MZV63_32480 [Marinilabiliales bacterium]|nr:hypothetical protein [Marinilabiliales bacterium]